MSVTAFETCSLDVLVDTRTAAVTDLFTAGLLVRNRLRMILDDVAERLGTPFAGVNLVREDAVLFVAATGAPAGLDEPGGMPAEWSPCRRVTSRDSPLVIGDLHADSWGHFPPSVLFGRMRSYVGVPLRTDGLVVGALCALSETPDAFDGTTVAWLEGRADEVLHIFDLGRCQAATPGLLPTSG
ncbi:GAF domain-containing protein [Actinoplanes regularis]|uniref:GAF domain-containing protein n=1 Tax=Actinoplanes regularis TaxID=52697 RepID=UPI002554BD56|nr:GAF domain-containing protein [Actinoplanes regularis]